MVYTTKSFKLAHPQQPRLLESNMIIRQPHSCLSIAFTKFLDLIHHTREEKPSNPQNRPLKKENSREIP